MKPLKIKFNRKTKKIIKKPKNKPQTTTINQSKKQHF